MEAWATINFHNQWHQQLFKAITPKVEFNFPQIIVVKGLKMPKYQVNSKRKMAEWFKIISKEIKTNFKIVLTVQMEKDSINNNRLQAKVENLLLIK